MPEKAQSYSRKKRQQQVNETVRGLLSRHSQAFKIPEAQMNPGGAGEGGEVENDAIKSRGEARVRLNRMDQKQ